MQNTTPSHQPQKAVVDPKFTRTYIEAVCDLVGGKHGPGLHSLILTEGATFHELAPLPSIAAYWQLPRACYRNASLMAVDNPRKYAYVEGLAVSSNASWLGPIPHAWVAEISTGHIIDPTWGHTNQIPTTYHGIPFRCSFIRACYMRTDHYGILCDPLQVRKFCLHPSTLRRAIHRTVLTRVRNSKLV